MSFIEAPMGMTMITWTGSGKSGPRKILFGFRSSAFIRFTSATDSQERVYNERGETARKILRRLFNGSVDFLIRGERIGRVCHPFCFLCVKGQSLRLWN